MKMGFTAIETIVVIVIIGILSVLGIMSFQNYFAMKLQAAANRLVSDIRYCQRLAIAKHEDYAIEFNLGVETYRLLRVSDNSTALDPLTRSDYIMDYTLTSEYQGIDLVSADFSGTTTLRFTSLGVPQDANGNNLTTSGTVVISYSGQSRTVSVIPETGLVRSQ